MSIELAHISKHFGPVRANDGVCLQVEKGTIHGLLGENGAGKTTLMKILSGYQPYDSGTMTLDGTPVRFGSPARAIAAGIGMLHQDPLDIPPMTVLDNFMLGRDARLFQRRREGRRELADLCRRFGFQLDPDTPAGSLTVGERQQLELVRLLALGVRVIILDEPTTGISAPQKELLFETLHRLAAEGLTVIFVSHKLDEVQELCSRATVLRAGKVAGETDAPFVPDELVEMMFGQCLTTSPRARVALGGPALEFDDVSVRTYRLSARHMSLQVREGEVIGLAGLEGSGQRLLMQACAGLQRIASGRLLIGGRDMTHQPYPRFLEMGVAYVPAARLEEGMVPGLSLREHFALTAEPNGPFIRWDRADERAKRMIGEFNIIGRPDTAVQQLSGGNQQRTILALLPDRVRVLILEHPTRGLDIESARWIWGRLLERRAQGTCILFTSTDLDELVENSDRIVVFSGGTMSEPMDASTITCEDLGYLIGGRHAS
jgi:simple sugar transport system ATP-binding protein